MREEDLLRLPLSDKRCELVEGVLVGRAPPVGQHAGVAAQFARLPGDYATQGRGGRALGEVGIGVTRDPDTVRGPDAAFFTAKRDRGLPTGFLESIPDVVVGVVAPNDTASEVHAKVNMWLDVGARLVRVAYADTEYVAAYRSKSAATMLTGDDVPDGGDTLPGFSVHVLEVFA